MIDSLAQIHGHGKLFIRDEVIEFTNKVTANFLVAPSYMLDRMGITRQSNQSYEPQWNTNSKFSVLAESPESSMSKIYTDMGSFNSTAFSLIQASLLKSTLRASGTITKTGTIRSAGFNVATFLPTAIVPNIPVPYRLSTISLVGATTVSRTSTWVYHAGQKALYEYTTTNIYKIPFDIETGVLGTETIIATNFGSYSSSYVNCTDGKNRVFRQINQNTMRIFNMENDSVTTVTLSQNVQVPTGIAWSTGEGLLRSFYGTGFTIQLNGTVTPDTGGLSSAVYQEYLFMITEDSILWSSGRFDRTNSTSPIISTHGSTGISAYQFICDNDKNYVIATFPNTSPSTMSLSLRREPDTSNTIISRPATAVTIGESFGIEYTFTVTDGR